MGSLIGVLKILLVNQLAVFYIEGRIMCNGNVDTV